MHPSILSLSYLYPILILKDKGGSAMQWNGKDAIGLPQHKDGANLINVDKSKANI
jgi:hypothetical protein